MTKFESSVKKVDAAQRPLFGFLSDIDNFSSLVSGYEVKNFHSEKDSCRFTIDGLGEIGVRVVSREPDNTIKFESEGQAPFSFNLWIQLKEAGDNQTAMKLTLKADLNPMMKMMAQKPLSDGLEIIASELTERLNKRDWA